MGLPVGINGLVTLVATTAPVVNPSVKGVRWGGPRVALKGVIGVNDRFANESHRDVQAGVATVWGVEEQESFNFLQLGWLL